jgi:hypothetical protein
MNPGRLQLFVDGKEDALPDTGRLDGLGLGDGSVLFALQRQGWFWEDCGSEMVLGDGGLVATVQRGVSDWQLVSGGAPMFAGRHYWELSFTSSFLLVGAVRPGLDHNHSHQRSNDAYFIFGCTGSLYGDGKDTAGEPQGKFTTGDRVGVLLDLDEGWIRFYRNGKRIGPGFTEGVTGPLVRAAHLHGMGTLVRVVPGAVAPEGAGAVDEPWVAPGESEEDSDSEEEDSEEEDEEEEGEGGEEEEESEGE